MATVGDGLKPLISTCAWTKVLGYSRHLEIGDDNFHGGFKGLKSLRKSGPAGGGGGRSRLEVEVTSSGHKKGSQLNPSNSSPTSGDMFGIDSGQESPHVFVKGAAAGDNRRAVGHMLERERGGAFSLTPSKLLSDFNSLGNFGAESRRMLLLLQLVAKASSLDVGLHNDFMHMLDELGVPVLSRVVELSKLP